MRAVWRTRSTELSSTSDDDGVSEAESVLQSTGQFEVDRPEIRDLDVHQADLPAELQQPGDLEPVQPQLVGDLDLGLALDVVATGDRRDQQ
jgi:hypothetical protein